MTQYLFITNLRPSLIPRNHDSNCEMNYPFLGQSSIMIRAQKVAKLYLLLYPAQYGSRTSHTLRLKVETCTCIRFGVQE